MNYKGGTMIERIERSYWEVKVHLREKEGDDMSPFLVANFATPELADFALEWAYQTRLEELRTRSDVIELDEHRWDDRSRKITWWQPKGNLFVCMKDYFYATERRTELTIINAA